MSNPDTIKGEIIEIIDNASFIIEFLGFYHQDHEMNYSRNEKVRLLTHGIGVPYNIKITSWLNQKVMLAINDRDKDGTLLCIHGELMKPA
jgi:hypothetical protein